MRYVYELWVCAVPILVAGAATLAVRTRNTFATRGNTTTGHYRGNFFSTGYGRGSCRGRRHWPILIKVRGQVGYSYFTVTAILPLR
jgi:hypothetical protein